MYVYVLSELTPKSKSSERNRVSSKFMSDTESSLYTVYFINMIASGTSCLSTQTERERKVLAFCTVYLPLLYLTLKDIRIL